jgi:hypothetical protein
LVDGDDHCSPVPSSSYLFFLLCGGFTRSETDILKMCNARVEHSMSWSHWKLMGRSFLMGTASVVDAISLDSDYVSRMFLLFAMTRTFIMIMTKIMPYVSGQCQFAMIQGSWLSITEEN